MYYFHLTCIIQVPAWVYLACAFGVFAYLAFDALDGKQSRRTRDGPAEEMFDHGFDSLSTVCVVLCVCFSMKLGREPMALLLLMCVAEVSCYMSILQKYATGIMKFGKIDVVEGNLAVAFIHILCAVSPAIFDTSIPVLHTTIRYLCITSNMIVSVIFVLNQSVDIIQTNISAPKGFSIVFPVVPIGLATGLQLMVAMTTPLYTDQPVLYLITFGAVVSKITLKLIVADITKDEVQIFDRIILGPIAIIINHYCGTIFPEYTLLWIVCIYSFQTWILYFWTVSREICRHLNIYCFNVTSRPSLKPRMSLGKCMQQYHESTYTEQI